MYFKQHRKPQAASGAGLQYSQVCRKNLLDNRRTMTYVTVTEIIAEKYWTTSRSRISGQVVLLRGGDIKGPLEKPPSGQEELT